MSIDIYLIEAPFQLVSAVATQKNNLDFSAWLFVRKSSSERNNTQLDVMLQRDVFTLPWAKIVYLDGSSPFKLLLASIKLCAMLSLILFDVNKFSIGDFRSRFALSIVGKFRFKELCLLDDGVGSLGLYYEKDGELVASPIEESSNATMSCLAALKSKVDAKWNRPELILSTFLTLPESTHWIVKKTDLSFVFDQFRIASQTIDDSLVYIVGSKVVESGVVDAKIYDIFCKNVRLSQPTANIIYIAHREESEEKISHYEKDLGFNISRPKMPLEFLLCSIDILPSSVISLYSAALFTTRLIEPKLNVVSYVLAATDIPPKFLKPIKACYCYLEADKEVTMKSLTENINEG
tara:strand:- start:646 stop:1695 length:1050 start_codon:yes stop_codon:yes gene_type:complete